MKYEQTTPDTLTVFLDGHLDLSTADTTRDDVIAHIKDAAHLIMDLSSLEYVSSAGLRTFLSLQKEMMKKGGDMTLTHVSDDVMSVLQVTGFNDILTIE